MRGLGLQLRLLQTMVCRVLGGLYYFFVGLAGHPKGQEQPCLAHCMRMLCVGLHAIGAQAVLECLNVHVLALAARWCSRQAAGQSNIQRHVITCKTLSRKNPTACAVRAAKQNHRSSTQ